MKENTDKFHLIMSTNNTLELKGGDYLIETSTCDKYKLLDVKIDYKLKFDYHVANLYIKANNKLRALTRATPCVTIEKKTSDKLFFNAQFNYCPLIWILHTRCNDSKIKHLHERCLGLIYCGNHSSYKELLQEDGSVSIHHRIIQNLAIEMYKIKNELSPMITAVFTTYLKTITIFVIIMVLDYLLEEQFTIALKYLVSRTKNMGYSSYRTKKCQIA